MSASAVAGLALAGVVGFWIVSFVVIVVMTRWALHGVGEITPEERSDLAALPANGASVNGRAAKQESGAAATGGH